MTYQPAFTPDWKDFLSLLILSDAEEERGNLRAAEVLRWIVREEKTPLTDEAMRRGYEFSQKSWDWRTVFTPTGSSSSVRCLIPDSLFCQLIEPADLSTYHSIVSRGWASYWSMEDAYLALVSVCLDYWETFQLECLKLQLPAIIQKSNQCLHCLLHYHPFAISDERSEYPPVLNRLCFPLSEDSESERPNLHRWVYPICCPYCGQYNET